MLFYPRRHWHPKYNMHNYCCCYSNWSCANGCGLLSAMSVALRSIIPFSKSKKIRISPWQRGGHTCPLACHAFHQFQCGIRLSLSWWTFPFQARYLIVVLSAIAIPITIIWTVGGIAIPISLITVLEALPFPKHHPLNRLVWWPKHRGSHFCLRSCGWLTSVHLGASASISFPCKVELSTQSIAIGGELCAPVVGSSWQRWRCHRLLISDALYPTENFLKTFEIREDVGCSDQHFLASSGAVTRAQPNSQDSHHQGGVPTLVGFDPS